jgi:hypothetical protein
MSVVVELHDTLAGQPLPPLPRQPSSHACAAVPQMRPLVAVPHSVSVTQPQAPFVAQTPDRQTSPVAHVPVPVGYPHLLSAALHAPERQTFAAFSAEQGPSPFG